MMGISKDMDVSLSKGAFALESSNEPGEAYYIRTPETILLYSHESIAIDTGIRVTLPYGHKGVLRSIYENDCDAGAILYVYGKGYLKGREDILKEQQQMKDYCKNDCDTLNKIWKEQKMDNSEMTRDELWSKVIKNLKTLDQEAHDEEFVPIITGLLVMTSEELRTSVANGTITQEDKSHMWSLVDELGCFSIKGYTIMYLPEYQELTALLRKVF